MKYLNRKLSIMLLTVLLSTLPNLSIFAQKVDLGDTFKGLASFYHSKFLGRKTASGEIFSRGAYTCAHKTLPFGTLIEVENPKTGKWVVVKVNDRGPFVKGRVLDLSIDAAEYLGITEKGVVNVKAKIVGFNGYLELIRDDNPYNNYNSYLTMAENPIKIPYLPVEKGTVTRGI